ncbi:MAG TPA: ABC transporter ATP-binding protein [Cyanobacteria bacterium UBA11162]|nr:ABC transporter ATP-binding protein [Cyanobacteria bacterium UBA11162]
MIDTDTILDVRHLQVEFKTDEKQVIAVNDIRFQVKRGQTLGIVGESGSGKSITSLAIMGLVPHPGKITKGEIYFHSSKEREEPVDLLNLSDEQKRFYRGNKIAMIFQEPMSSLNPVYNIGFQLIEAIQQHENVSSIEAKGLAIARLQEVKLLPSDAELRKQYLKELQGNNRDKSQPRQTELQDQDFDIPHPLQKEIDHYINQQKRALLKRYPHELSGGQLQRVMIAMAIACNPDILIADEPSTALDVTIQAEILDLLRDLRDQRGMSIIFITHDLGVIAEIADTVAVMYQGKIVEDNDVLEIFSNPQHPYTKALLACRPRLDQSQQILPTVSDFMEVVTDQNGNIEIREKLGQPPVITPAEGINNEESSAPPILDLKPPLLSAENLRVGFPIQGMFGGIKRYIMAVNDVSFKVYPRETLGLVGESGCGKSTLARTLLRLIEPMKGKVKFEGEDITNWAGKDLRHLRRQIQIIFQNPFSSLDPRMKIGEAIMEPLVIHKTGGNTKKRRDRVAYLLERVGLDPNSMNRYPHEFSGGQRQRVCIARSLALEDTKLIICDESVSALDVSVQAQVLNLLKELQQEFDLTYIFISHDLSVVKFMSDRIMVMNEGKIEEIESAESIYDKPQTEYTSKLIKSIPTGSLDRIQRQQTGRRSTQWLRHIEAYSSRPSEKLQHQLFVLLQGDWKRAKRLLDSAKQNHPGFSEDWYWEKVIYDLERDRQ